MCWVISEYIFLFFFSIVAVHFFIYAAIGTASAAAAAAAAADINERNKINKLKDATTQNSISTSDSRETMNDELAKVLKLYREKSHNWDIHKTPEIFIQPTSSPANVKQWLKAKGFSDYVVQKFGYLSGNELFSLDRETLEEHCGVEEGKRLLSQITVQRNVSGVNDFFHNSHYPKKKSLFIHYVSFCYFCL